MPAVRDEEASAISNSNGGLIKDDVAPTQSLQEQCERVHGKVYAFLGREARTERLRSVQEQTRISLGVIGEALGRYT